MPLFNSQNSKKKLVDTALSLTPNSKIAGLNLMRIFLSFGAALLYKIFFPIKNVSDYTSGFRAFKVGPIKKAWKQNKKTK